ncbi:hypothetical protein MKX07_007830 [Trichoderma sp. CBMAI-0711]|nr:hypothetical protein MKX07_007830 [Trichoderma sp. CBMAI-0711]
MPVIASKPDFIIQSASSLNQNRDELDANTHFTVARHGEDWLLLVPTGSIEPSGMVIGFTYPNQTGWVGFFIMNEGYRGRGWGAALFKAMLDTYQKNGIHTVGLDAVQEQVNTYARREFVEAARIKLMTRVSAHEVPISYADKQPKQGHRVTDIREVDARAMASLDHAHTGLYRPALWTEEALFSRPDAFGFAILSEASDDLQGLILIRRLIAETFGPNEHAARVFSDLGWQWAGVDYHRMWLKGRVPIEQQEGGKGPRGMFAVFDAGQG